jgi:starch-binding outer membrane protein, SusD/RagB family
MTMHKAIVSLTTVVALQLCACDFNVPDLNNAGVIDLEKSPTRALVTAAAIGLLDGHRTGLATPNGYVSQLGIIGREAFNFDPADPRYVSELLTGQLDRSGPFGGAFWGGPYGNIRLANLTAAASDKVADYSTMERDAIKGFAHTMIALDLLRVIVTHDTNGAVIDTDRPLGSLGKIASKAEVYAKIVELLDQAKVELGTGGTSFSFPMNSGFAGFDDPKSFIKFNRAIRARVAMYTGDFAAAVTALSESFLDATANSVDKLNVGPSLNFSPNAGDTENLLTNTNIFAHPSFTTDAQKNGTVIDDRFTRKITVLDPGDAGSSGDLESNLQFMIYGSSEDTAFPIPLIRNEELILLRAEAAFRQGRKGDAIGDINIIRTISGGLAGTTLTAASTDEQFITEILYNRRYSLMFEGGHRWIDLRRFGRIGDLKCAETGQVCNVRYPIPQSECDARPGEPSCSTSSI